MCLQHDIRASTFALVKILVDDFDPSDICSDVDAGDTWSSSVAAREFESSFLNNFSILSESCSFGIFFRISEQSWLPNFQMILTLSHTRLASIEDSNA